MNKKIYNKLIEVAKKGTVIYETDIARVAGYNLDLPHERREMGRDLDEINSNELGQGRPVLSSVIVQRETLMPGRRFFDYCRDAGLLKTEDEDEFYIREQRKAYVFWASQ
jgi:hypothetical protein